MNRPEQGFAAIWTAVVLLFLVGATALAVDTSGFFRAARADQTGADLACLAGVKELPGNVTGALTQAEGNVKNNFPRVSAGTAVTVGNDRTITVGGNVVLIQANYLGDTHKMRVRITSSEGRHFSRVWSSTNVPVVQEAVCTSIVVASGPGVMPVAALPGLFNGDLFNCAAKVTGNCGAIDAGTGSNDWRDALDNGIDADLEKHHGNWTSADADTGHVGTQCSPPAFANSCNANDTETGNMTGPFNQGMRNRLSDITGASCIEGGDFNCDSLAQVIGTQPGTLSDAQNGGAWGAGGPSWWQSSLYGAYTSAKPLQYYYDGDIAKCDSPRLATIPIMNYSGGSGVPNNWNLGGAAGTWPNGRKTMKIVGFYTVYIREPDHRNDVGNGNGNGLGQIVADILWFGPNATCNGQPVQFFGGPPVDGGIKLVAG
jgi:hypothetical protein